MAINKTVSVEEPPAPPGVYLNPITMEFSVVTSCRQNENGIWVAKVWPVGGGQPKELLLAPETLQEWGLHYSSFGSRLSDKRVTKTVLDKFIGDIEDLMPPAEKALRELSEAAAAGKLMLPKE